jgi:hypothetical protein
MEGDMFESITRPGVGLRLESWADAASATARTADRPGRTRIVRVIRDYGMRRREEAPQYYPAAPAA